MTYDIATRVSNNQSLVGVPFAVSTNSILVLSLAGTPSGIAGRDLGRGEPLVFRVFVTQAFDAGVASLNVSVLGATDAALTAGTVFYGTTGITNSGLGLGNEFDVRIPSFSEAQALGVAYLGLFYAPSALPATGAVSAWIPLGHSPGLPRRLVPNYLGP